MIAALVLITGITMVLLIGTVYLIVQHQASVLPSIVPLAPWLVAIGCILLILSELILFFGKREDKRTAVRDLAYLIPTMLISAGLGYIAQHFFW